MLVVFVIMMYSFSLHDALPIWHGLHGGPPRRGGLRAADAHGGRGRALGGPGPLRRRGPPVPEPRRSEENTSELQSPCYLVYLILNDKKIYVIYFYMPSCKCGLS